MSEYRRLDFSKLNFSDNFITTKEALENVTPLKLSNNVILNRRQIVVTKAEKDYENKCVKFWCDSVE